jgi:putative acetyltransferase
MMVAIEITQVDPKSKMGRELVAHSSAEQIARYGRDGGRTIEDLCQPGVAFFAAMLEGAPAGCGAVVEIEPRVGELSRIFVKETARRRGVGAALLQGIEEFARGRFDRLVLETGVAQQESVALYESRGYSSIKCWGKSADNPRSLCYEKRLST